VLLVHGQQAFDPSHSDDATNAGAVTRNAAGGSSPALQSMSPIIALARNVSIRPATRLFAVVSQISPNGGENLEDLALLDESDPNQWLLIVAVRRNGNSIVYRMLYHGPSGQGGD
jgi:hypothetical protein